MADTTPGPAAAPGPEFPADDESRHWQAAAEIRRQHPRWVTIWVARAGHYRAWPLFRAPRGTSLTAQAPEELTAQMDQIEQAAPPPRRRTPGENSRPSTQPVPRQARQPALGSAALGSAATG